MDKRAIFDSLLTDLKLAPSAGSQDAFPLDRALVLIDERTTQREGLLQQISPESAQDRRLGGMLVICDAVSVATKAAIAMVEKEGGNAREQSAALVDLWGKAEAARALWFESYVLWPADCRIERMAALSETSLQIAAEAMGLALRFSSPSRQFADFVAKVLG